MAHQITGTLYKLTYAATWHDFVECSSKEDLFRYVAQEIIRGQIVTSVTEMCKDGSTPKVKVHTDKDFKRILKSFQNPREVRMIEHFWTNERGCHYQLTPADESKVAIQQIATDAGTLSEARARIAKRLQEMFPDLKIIIERTDDQ